MIKFTNKFYGASLVALAFSLSAADVSAQTCTTAPSCDTLGFTKSATDCEGHSVLKCPFDQSKLYCDSGATGGNSGGEESNCGVGDILYSDKTCSIEPISRKTPIGVVFDQSRGLAIALDTEQKKWSDEIFDVPGLPNLSDAKGDYSGKSNTAKVVEYCKTNGKSCPAFEYVANYSTRGTSAGEWYLPAWGELKTIYDNKATLNATLAKLSSASQFPDNAEWSSSEKDQDLAWSLYFGTGNNFNYYNKDRGNYYIRPVLAF